VYSAKGKENKRRNCRGEQNHDRDGAEISKTDIKEKKSDKLLPIKKASYVRTLGEKNPDPKSEKSNG